MRGGSCYWGGPSCHVLTTPPSLLLSGKVAVDASASSAGPPPTWVREGDAAAYALLAANFPQLVQVRGGMHSAACLGDR